MCIREQTEGSWFFYQHRPNMSPSCCQNNEGMGEFIMVKIHSEIHKCEVLHKPRKQHMGQDLPAVRDTKGEAWVPQAAPVHAEGL